VHPTIAINAETPLKIANGAYNEHTVVSHHLRSSYGIGAGIGKSEGKWFHTLMLYYSQIPIMENP
jgi:hypothetical protein